MKKLEAGSRRTASLLVAASILVVFFASGLWGQTTYSSPVRVTNTPLPVAAPNPLPVSSPKPLTVSGSVAVTPTSGQPLIVSPNGGQMTVAPAGGTMPISGMVALSGTPQVALSATGNTVNLAGTPYVARYEATLGDGFSAGDLLLFDNTSGGLHEVETTIVSCTTPVGQKIVRTFLSIQFGGSAAFAIPMTFMGTNDFFTDSDMWVGSVPGKVYVPAGAKVYLFLIRHTPTTGTISCVVGMAGRLY